MIPQSVFICLLTLFLLPACQSLLSGPNLVSQNLAGYSSGSFSGFVVFQQGAKKSYFTAAAAVSQKEHLRINLMASMGLPAASILLKDRIGTVLFLQKKLFYKGPGLKQALKTLLNFPLDIALFKDILFERAPRGSLWSCRKDNAMRLKRCVYKDQVIEWDRTKGKTVSFKAPLWSVVFHYSKFTPQTKEKMFILKIPDHFKPILTP